MNAAQMIISSMYASHSSRVSSLVDQLGRRCPQVRKDLPARIDVLPGLGRRHLAENHHGPQPRPPPLLPEPFAAEAPLTAPGAHSLPALCNAFAAAEQL